MKPSKKPKDGPANSMTTMRIEGDMNIYRAAELKKLLQPSLDDQQVLELDLSDVTELDSAGVQLLVLAKNSAQARHGTLRLTARSPAVDEVLELFGLGDYFDGPLAVLASKEAPAGNAPTPSGSRGMQ